MREKFKRVLTCLAVCALIISAVPVTSFAANPAPEKIMGCESYFRSDFYITLDSSEQSWLEAITNVTVAGMEYSKVDYLFGVNRNTCYYTKAADGILMIGEGAITEGTTAECVIKASGYEDFVLELDKSSYKAEVKISDNKTCEHVGGKSNM